MKLSLHETVSRLLTTAALLALVAAAPVTPVIAQQTGAAPPPVEAGGRPRILRSWAGTGDWRVHLVRGSTDEAPGCVLVNGTSASGDPSQIAAPALPRVGGPPGAGGAAPGAQLVAPRPAAPRAGTMWGFRITGDEVAVIINDRDMSLLQMPLIIVVVDGEVVGALPVSRRQAIDTDQYAITAMVANPALRDVFLGLIPMAGEITLQIAGRNLTGSLDQAGDALKQFGACRQEARLLTAARAAR